MMRLLYGNTGSGKTQWTVAQIMEDLRHHASVVLIVPEQQSMETELLLSEAAEREDLSTLSLEVLSFSRLANRVFREAGGLSYRYIDRGGRALLMWHTLYRLKPVLTAYGGVRLTDRGMIGELLRAVETFGRYSITPAALEEAAAAFERDREVPRLGDKLHDLALIYASFSELLHRDYDDPADDLTRLAALLGTTPFFAGKKVYFDGFHGFTRCEFDVLEAILRQSELVTVTLAYRPESRLPLFAPLRQTDHDLRRTAQKCGCPILPDTVLTEPRRFAALSLAQIEASLWDYRVTDRLTDAMPEGVTLHACANLFEEADYVAREILRSVRTGARLRDHVVIARDLTRYRGVIDAVFTRYGIPFFWSERTSISEKPLIRLILSSLAVLSGSWQRDDVIACVKTGLMLPDDRECDLLENYTAAWSISGKQWTEDEAWTMNPDGYVERITPRGSEILEAVNASRDRITAPLTALAISLREGCTVREACTALFEYLEALSVCEKIEAQGDSEAIALWNTVTEALDQLVVTSGEARINAEIFSHLLSLVFESADFGRVPTAMDQVLIGNAAGIRVGDAKYAFLIGANDGIFPANAEQNGLFSDAELVAMEGRELVISPRAELRGDEELLHFYRAAVSVSHALTVTYAVAEPDGTALRPSSAVTRLCTLFPALAAHLHDDHRGDDPLSSVLSAEDLPDLAVRQRGTPLGSAAASLCREIPSLQTRIEVLQRPQSVMDEQLSPATAKAVFGGDLNLSSTRLDQYVKCRFRYLCRYVLRLKPSERITFNAMNVGSFVHRILEVFLKSVYESEDGVDAIDREAAFRRLDDVIDETVREVIGSVRVGQKRLQSLFRRLRHTTHLLVDDLLDELQQSEFRPTFFEFPIGDGDPDGIPSLRVDLPDGGAVRLFGKIDRVDTYRRGSDVYFRVVDYKTGTQKFKLADVEKGLDLQMLLYLFSIWKNAGTLFRARVGAEEGELYPAGVIYYPAHFDFAKIQKEMTDEEIIAEVKKGMRREGILLDDEEIIRAMDRDGKHRFVPRYGKPSMVPVKTLEEFGTLFGRVTDTVRRIAEEMRSGYAAAEPIDRFDEKNECEYCQMKMVCRYHVDVTECVDSEDSESEEREESANE